MKKRVAFLINQFTTVQSGPGRFTEYLKKMQWDEMEMIFISHQVVTGTELEKKVSLPAWIRLMPLAWIFRSFYYSKTLKKLDRERPFDAILTVDFSLGLFISTSDLRNRLYSMVNDDNYLRIFEKGEHTKGMSTDRLWARRLGYFLESFVSRRAKMIIANSLYTKGLILSIYKIPSDRVFLLYKAVDLSLFSPRAYQPTPPLRYLFVKNDWRRGGLDLIIKAFSRVTFGERIHFTVAGISPEFQDIIREIAEKEGFKGGLKITGLLNREELKKYLEGTDVFISMSRQEALGVACLEAMASGVPVIASNAGGLKEVLDFGNAGFMIENESVDDLVAKLEEIFKNPELMEAKIANGLLQAEKFSVDRLRQNISRLFS